VVTLTLAVNNLVQDAFTVINKYLDGWMDYGVKYELWHPKRRARIEKAQEEDASPAFFERVMLHYQSIKDSIQAQKTLRDMKFLRIDAKPLEQGLLRQAECWRSEYGEALLACSRKRLNQFSDTMGRVEHTVRGSTDTLEELKQVLNGVLGTGESRIDDEVKASNLVERYGTLRSFGIDVPESEMEEALHSLSRCQNLYVEARTRDLRLKKVKDNFREVTRQNEIEFREEVREVRRLFLDAGPGTSSITLDEGLDLLKDYQKQMKALNGRKEELVNALILFSLEVNPFPDIASLNEDLGVLATIYGVYESFKRFKEDMGEVMWSDLDIAILQEGLSDFTKQLKSMSEDIKAQSAFKAVDAAILNFKESLPLTVSLKGESMKLRHWQKIVDTTGVSLDVSNLNMMTLGNIFEMELHRFSTDIEEIVNESVQEAKIEVELQKIEEMWSAYDLQVIPNIRPGTSTSSGWILLFTEELRMDLDDNMLNLQTMAGSRFISSFQDKCKFWERSLNLVSDCLDMWSTVQKKWMYLESIFASEDIRLQLPDEAKKFDGIDKAFRTIMNNTHKNPKVVEACTADNRFEVLSELSDILDQTQKGLSDYLNTKRQAFPRFYFISDDELLSILGSSDATCIQLHLMKLFDNVKAFTFARNDSVITAMTSSEGESFDLREIVDVSSKVEVWMTAAEDEMRSSLHAITKEGVYYYAQQNRIDWISSVLGMVSISGSQIWWTWEVEDAFKRVASGDKHAMKNLEHKLTSQLNDMVAMIRTTLPRLIRKKVNTLLIVDVHARDIIDGFVRESILNEKEFAWESQLRFYWDRVFDDIRIKQCTGTFLYGYEYQGLNGRLVITPLTDRCVMTLTQALTFKLGGSPAGPAGTGKTETVKDLAKSLGLICFVVNCGEGLDYKAMGAIFSGLV
jgi:dynein heavy chain